MARQAIRMAIFAGAALGCSSCFWFTSKGDGEQLRRDLEQANDRIATLEGQLSEEQARLTEMIEHARAEMEELEATLTRATRVLARNSADFGAEMESIKDRVREFDGRFAEIEHQVQEVDRQSDATQKRVVEFALAAGLDLPVDESTVPDEPAAHLAKIEESLSAERYGEARELAKLFQTRYPKHDDLDKVQLLIARSYLQQKRWAKALGALRRFTDVHPKSEHTPEVLYEMANAFFQLGDCTDARILVEAVTTRHKKSPFAEKATRLLEQMDKHKNRCTS